MAGFNHIVIYSHGFGVRKDDRGLFTDITNALPNARHILFDYNQVDEATGNLIVAPLDKQAERLGQVIAETKAKHPDSAIDLVCHSQGCIVAALLNPQDVGRVVFVGPPAKLSVDEMIRIFTSRPGSKIDLHGISRLQRADFSTTSVPSEYWKNIENIDPIALYNELAKHTSLIVINATEDEVLGAQDFSALLPNIKIVEIKTGHNFEGEARQHLINVIRQELELDWAVDTL